MNISLFVFLQFSLVFSVINCDRISSGVKREKSNYFIDENIDLKNAEDPKRSTRSTHYRHPLDSKLGRRRVKPHRIFLKTLNPSEFLDRVSNKRPNVSKRPNIIFMITDDQDIELGSMQYMPKTMKVMAGGGHFSNAYVTTPMCCPSRSSMLTGLYTHNHDTYTNRGNCSSVYWRNKHEVRTFATYLSTAGYRTAFFGKYLNEYDGNYIPPGWGHWSALIRNSRFYNYTINTNGQKIKHHDNYHFDYYPDLIVNESLKFFHHSRKNFPEQPVMAVISFPAPHGPEDAAPQYQHLFFNSTSHHTPSWNYAPNPDKQWILRRSQSLSELQVEFTNMLNTKRLQTLQSVDDSVERVYNMLSDLNELENTYIFYTSDHGYHLGQFGLVKGKSMPFEFDVRVPFFVRGPSVASNSSFKEIVLNIDLAPTFLDIAGVKVPDHMDGKSILPILRSSESHQRNHQNRAKQRVWRDSFLIERIKIEGPNAHIKDSHPLSKKDWLKIECDRPEYQGPCKKNQHWQCIFENGVQKMRKCRSAESPCDCSQKNRSIEMRFSRIDNQTERQRQLEFLKQHVTSNFRARFRRSISLKIEEFDVASVYHLKRMLDSSFDNGNDGSFFGSPIIDYHTNSGCLLFANSTVSCSKEIYNERKNWQKERERINNLIKRLRHSLVELEGIKAHLEDRQPNDVGCDCDDRPSFRRSKNPWKKRLRKHRRKQKFLNTTCDLERMNCFTHDDNHWKTPPFWTKGQFCFCQNANNNSFSCLRTINETHNILYCEYITGFLTYYDLNEDPYQLKNMVLSLDWNILKKLQRKLNRLKICAGNKECTMRFRHPKENGEKPREIAT